MKPVNQICPSCKSTGMSVYNELNNVPVHSVLLFSSQDDALNYPRGDISLGFCEACGFIANVAFDPNLHEYSGRYEATQGYSSTFNAFHRNLAQDLIDRYNLRSKDVIEIGCGQGEFLRLLCELGDNRGIGFDPAFDHERIENETKAEVTIIKDFYSEKYAAYRGDFVCCKMTLEHIQQTDDFVHIVRRSVGDQPDTIVFFQVPNVTRILREIAFWDIYYEHCSYFSMGSLARLFRRCGFDVINLAQEYDDQYLMIEARPGTGHLRNPLSQENDLDVLKQDVAYFIENYPLKLDMWRRRLDELKRDSQHVVIWGAGSKGVSFLTTLGVQEEIEYAVDVNPYKHGTFMAGTGHKIVAPEFLQHYQPDVVILMNPIYCDEVQQDLDRMGITAMLLPV